jgi:hypothetical protein
MGGSSEMDAATLYIVLTLPNGEQSTSTQKVSTLEACEAQVELFRTVEPLDRQSPVTSYRCEGHNPFAFVAPYRRGRSWRLVELFASSLQASRLKHPAARAGLGQNRDLLALHSERGDYRAVHARSKSELRHFSPLSLR